MCRSHKFFSLESFAPSISSKVGIALVPICRTACSAGFSVPAVKPKAYSSSHTCKCFP